MKFLLFLDSIAGEVSRGGFTMDNVSSTLLRAKASARKTLREDPTAMIRILNEFDFLGDELTAVVSELMREQQ